MITDYLFLAPDGELLCTLQEIRRYVELHCEDRFVCLDCGCYQIPDRRPRGFLFHAYRCANTICSSSRRVFRLWSLPAGRPT